jgi:hypothetical protein
MSREKSFCIIWHHLTAISRFEFFFLPYMGYYFPQKYVIVIKIKRKGKPGESRGRKAMGLYAMHFSNDCQAAVKIKGSFFYLFNRKKKSTIAISFLI